MKTVRHTLSNLVLPSTNTPLGGWGLYCKGAFLSGSATKSTDSDAQLSFSAGEPVKAVDPYQGSIQVHEEGIAFKGEVDFFTYFNACSLEKWKRYAQLDRIHIEFEVDHLDGIFQWVGRSEKDTATRALEGGVRLLQLDHETTKRGTYVLTVEVPDTDEQVVGFVLQTHDDMRLFGGRYFTTIEESSVNPVLLALCTTTFQKEDYIVPNIDLLKAEILDCDEPIAQNFELFVVDNGRTLDVEALGDEHVHIIPNKNVGGAGGFARGMMEAMASDRDVTHVLLMDDDVSISAESIKRTYNLLALAKGSYEEAFINGAMLTLDQPNREYEDVSYVRNSGGYHKVKPDLFVDRAEDIVANEAISVEVPNAYGAWWFNCIPVKRIHEIGLPLPLFIRCDDVDFGLRARATYMTMNGICVWHEAFDGRFRASVDCYQYVRNYLIAIACDEIASERLFMARVERDIRFNMRFMSYDTVELLLDALEDYLKGPEFIMEPKGDAIMKEKGAKNETMTAVEEMGDPRLVEATDRYAAGDDIGSFANAFIKVWRTLPYDRHLLPDGLLRDKTGVGVYTSSANFAWDSLLTKSIVAIDHHGRSAAVRKMDKARYNELMARWRKLRSEYKLHGKEVRRAYRAAQPKLTSWDFWNEYLGTDLRRSN